MNFWKELKEKMSSRFILLMLKLERCSKKLRLKIKSLTSFIKSKFNDDFTPKLDYQTHYFIFLGDCDHSFDLFCRKGYKHVFVAKELEHCWLIYNPTRFGLEVFVEESSKDMVSQIFSSGRDITKIVKIVSRETRQNLLLPPQALTCVRLCGYIAGLKFGITRQTPYSIYRYLVTQAQDEPHVLNVNEIVREE